MEARLKPIYVKVCRRVISFVSEYPKEVVEELSSYSVPGAFWMPAYHRFHKVRKLVNGEYREVAERVWDGKKHLLNQTNDTLPAGLFKALVVPELKKLGYKILYEKKSLPVPVSQEVLTRTRKTLTDAFPETRPFQVDAVLAMLKSLHQGGLVTAATGSGKTYVAGMFFFSLGANIKCLFVVDELTLLHQAQKELEKVAGEPVGIVGEGLFQPERITVATIQTLWKSQSTKKFKDWFESIRIVVIDEIHVQMNRRNFGIVTKVNAQAVYGLTATLQLKKKDVRVRAHALTGPVLYEYGLAQGVAEKFLTQPIVVMVEYQGLKDKPGERFQFAYQRQITHCTSRNQLLEDIARSCLDNQRRVIVLVSYVRHLKFMFRRLKNKAPQLVYGGKKSVERILIQKDFEKGLVKLIITNVVFEKGINIKVADTGINGAAESSRNKSQQKIGRLVRLSEGKEYALYVDIYDKGNRYQKNAEQRIRAYKELKIPILVVDEESIGPDWFKTIDQKIRKVLKIKS